MKLTFENLLFSTTKQLKISKIPNIILSVNPITTIIQPNAYTTLSFNLTSLGQPSCAFIDFSLKENSYNQYAIGTDASTCSSIFPGATFSGTYVLNSPTNNVWSFPVLMSKSGYVLMKANVSNLYSSIIVSTYVSVSSTQCERPLLSIGNSSTLFYSPTNITRSTLFTLLASITLRCSSSISNNKLWTVYMVNPMTGIDIKQVNLPTSSFSTNAELVVPANLLDYGLYRFEFKVQMTSTTADLSAFTSETSAFIRIVPSGLVIQALNGGVNQIELVRKSLIFLIIEHFFITQA
jgi:hypothetical protein